MAAPPSSPPPLQAAPPPLLLPKRLTSFLHANLSPGTTATLLLLTPSGKLLAHASPLPASALRTQCTVAASLWAIHSASAGSIAGALPQQTVNGPGGSRGKQQDETGAGAGSYHQHQQAQAQSSSRYRAGRPGSSTSSNPSTVSVQLSSGATVVVCRLRCGLLFVAIGPATVGAGGGGGSDHHQQQHAGMNVSMSTSPSHFRTGHHDFGGLAQLHHPGLSSSYTGGHSLHPASAATTAAAAAGGGGGTGQPQSAGGTPLLGSPSEGASVLSASAASIATGVSTGSSSGAPATGAATRRHAEELAKWLDEKLGGLCVPEEGIGASLG